MKTTFLARYSDKYTLVSLLRTKMSFQCLYSESDNRVSM